MEDVNTTVFLKLGNQITRTKCAKKVTIQE
ncbi:hypothetical protein Bhyg_17138, partial [Pseudolycoriella hygida]